ncbi:MAG: capsid cement protein [Terriglobales bacterium]
MTCLPSSCRKAECRAPPIIVGSIFGIAVHDALEYSEVETQLVGVFELPKGSEQLDQGDAVFWDDGNGVITGTGTAGFFPVGVVTDVRVRLTGAPVTAVAGT